MRQFLASDLICLGPRFPQNWLPGPGNPRQVDNLTITGKTKIIDDLLINVFGSTFGGYRINFYVCQCSKVS